MAASHGLGRTSLATFPAGLLPFPVSRQGGVPGLGLGDGGFRLREHRGERVGEIAGGDGCAVCGGIGELGSGGSCGGGEG